MDDALAAARGRRPVPASLAEAINHEFRNPLATLLGHLELVADVAEGLPEDVAHSVEVMQRVGMKLAELVAAAADIAEIHELAQDSELADLTAVAG